MGKKANLIVFLGAVSVIGGCAKEFPKQSLDAETQSFRENLESSAVDNGDFDTRLQLGRLYFENNYIDEADAVLSALVEEKPGHAEAAAWYGANNCKLAGRAQPWLMGFRKLYLINQCLEQVDSALAKAPDDFTVRLTSINTGLEVAMFGSGEKARAELEALSAEVLPSADNYPDSLIAHIYRAKAKAAELSGEAAKEKEYLEAIVALDAVERKLIDDAQSRLSLLAQQSGG